MVSSRHYLKNTEVPRCPVLDVDLLVKDRDEGGPSSVSFGGLVRFGDEATWNSPNFRVVQPHTPLAIYSLLPKPQTLHLFDEFSESTHEILSFEGNQGQNKVERTFTLLTNVSVRVAGSGYHPGFTTTTCKNKRYKRN